MSEHAFKGPKFFFSFGGSIREVLVLFCSQCVPQHVPNSTLLHLISFALSFILVTFISSPKGGHYHISILGPHKALLIFFLWWTNQHCPLERKKKELWGAHNYLIWVTIYFYTLVLTKAPPLCQFWFARKPYLYGLEPKPKDVFFQRLLLHYSLEKIKFKIGWTDHIPKE